ncbi:MAG: serine/threonine protein kinase [Planctomycetota bacterium]
MNPERWARVKDLFRAARELPEERRERFLVEACADDPDLRREVESLLRHDRPETILAAEGPPRPPRGGETAELRMSLAEDEGRTLLRRGRRLKVLTVVATLVLVGVGLWIHARVAASLGHSVRAQLVTSLEQTLRAVRLHFEDERERVRVLARDPDVVAAAEGLCAVDRSDGRDPAALARELEAAAGNALAHRDLDSSFQTDDLLGWYLADRAGLLLALGERGAPDAGVDERIRPGQRVPARLLGWLERAFGGEAFLTPPLPVERPRARGALDRVVLSAWSPVADQGGRIVAVLVLALDPARAFTPILDTARLGATGETYAFDERGYMLSESRFLDRLRAVGLVPDGDGTTAILRVRLLDPGRELRPGEALPADLAARPKTHMLRAALAHRDVLDADVDGYRDYRGVPVAGAWTWLGDLGFGIATEQDLGEAYAPLASLERSFLILFALLVVAVGFIVTSSWSILKLERRVEAAEQIGPYTLLRRIGEGGLGEVWLADHRLLQRPTAIKLLKADVVNAETLRRFEREVRLTSTLTHPNTIEIYDFGTTRSGTFYYAMEYLPGLTLFELLRLEGRVPPGRTVHLLGQVCASLAEAHAKGLIHRDLKPQNLMLCERGGRFDVVKVLDFGLVKQLTSDVERTAPEQLAGTPMYIAPERLLDPSRVDARTDLYSLGTIAFNLLSGSQPFPGTTSVEICTRIVEDEPARLDAIEDLALPPALVDLVARLLAKDPDARPPSAAAVAAELAALAVPAWSAADAEAWWRTHRDELPSLAREALGQDAAQPVPASGKAATSV